MQAYMKEIRTEVEQGLKATLDATRRNLKTTETRLRQHTEICIKDVEDEIRGLKNEVVPGLRMVSDIYLFLHSWHALILITIGTESGQTWARTSGNCPISKWG